MSQRNIPVEFYGKLFAQAQSDDVVSALQLEDCPFTHARCSKIRKSAPTQTIGSCTLGYQGAPLIICPKRFLQDQIIFRDCVPLLPPCEQFAIVPEVAMPGGSVDYFLVGLNGASIVDFVGIEIQALDTTGSGAIWQAREDLLRGTLADSYPYSINWKMSAKTILVQLLHKAASFEALGKKLVLVIQKEFADYLDREFQTDGLHPALGNDAVHFHLYTTVESQGSLNITLRERKSTNLSGIEHMLNIGRDANILLDDVVSRISARLPGTPLQ